MDLHPLDRAQLLHGDLRAVRDAGGKAGRRRLVPELQIELAGDGPDLPLAESRIAQWSRDAELLRGRMAGTIVADVVARVAVGDGAACFLARHALADLEQGVFAEKAAVAVVANVLFERELSGFDD